MQTRRSPPQSNKSNSDDGNAGTSDLPSTSGAVHWTVEEEAILIDFLVADKAEAGDGLNFKASVWTAAAEHMRPHTKKGGIKTASKCKSKWTRLRAAYQTVNRLKSLSGLTWDDEKGLNIDITTASAWNELVHKQPDVKPYKNKGFVHYDRMFPMMPTIVRGTHAFRPSQQSFGAVANRPISVGDDNSMPPPPQPSMPPQTLPPMHLHDLPLPRSSPPPPPNSTLSISSGAISSLSSGEIKRKRSAREDSDSTSMLSPSLLGPQEKRQRSSAPGATAIFLGAKMDKMSDTFAAGFAADERARANKPEHSPKRRMRASRNFQRLEKDYMTNEQKIAIMDLFETNTAAADTFLTMDEGDEALRWSWISNKLQNQGFPPLPPRASDADQPEL